MKTAFFARASQALWCTANSALLLSLFFFQSVFAQEQPEFSMTAPNNHPDGVFAIPPGSVVLLDQTGSPTGLGVTSQKFEAFFGPVGTQAADDFFVSDADGWLVTQVNALGFDGIGNSADTVDVLFFEDDGGKPGNEVCAFPGIAANNSGGGNLQIDLPVACPLSGSETFWVTVQAREDFLPQGYQWFWLQSSVLTNASAHVRDPDALFPFEDCRDWTPIKECFSSGGFPAADLSFSIVGMVGSGEGKARFQVTKDFADGVNPMEVDIDLDCFTGLDLNQQQTISETRDVEFIVGDYTPGNLDCMISEQPVAGYTPTYFARGPGASSDEDGCHFDDLPAGAETVCHIVNYPDPVAVVVNKVWITDGIDLDELESDYEIELKCNSEIVGGFLFEGSWVNGYYGNDSESFIFHVIPRYPYSTCTVKEHTYIDYVEPDNDCGTFRVKVGGPVECQITNTVFYEGVPTMSQYGMAILSLLILGIGMVGFRRFI